MKVIRTVIIAVFLSVSLFSFAPSALAASSNAAISCNFDKLQNALNEMRRDHNYLGSNVNKKAWYSYLPHADNNIVDGGSCYSGSAGQTWNAERNSFLSDGHTGHYYDALQTHNQMISQLQRSVNSYGA